MRPPSVEQDQEGATGEWLQTRQTKTCPILWSNAISTGTRQHRGEGLLLLRGALLQDREIRVERGQAALVVIPHPISDNGDDELRVKAADAVRQSVALLTERSELP